VRFFVNVTLVLSVCAVLFLTLDPYAAQSDAVIATDRSALTLGVLPTAGHALMFAWLGFLVTVRWQLSGRPLTRQAILGLLALAALAGAADEQAQRFVASHGPELVDWVADVAGAAFGFAAGRWVGTRWPVVARSGNR